MEIRQAKIEDLEDVLTVYADLIDAMQGDPSKPKWQKGIYPSKRFLQRAIEKEELFVAVEADTIISAIIINGDHAEEYSQVEWPSDITDADFYVIHVLAISPQWQGKGIAKRMVAFAIDYAKRQGKKAIRLEALEENVAARKLYLSAGFHSVGPIKIFSEDKGWINCQLFELLI